MLREYQLEGVEAIESVVSDRSVVHVLALPTGTGKTAVANEVIARFLRGHRDRSVLWLAPKWELLRQAEASLARDYSQLRRLLRRIGGDEYCLPAPEQPGGR